MALHWTGIPLGLNYGFDNPMTPDKPEYLSVGVSRYESDTETEVDDLHVKDGFGVIYKLSEYGIPVPVEANTVS